MTTSEQLVLQPPLATVLVEIDEGIAWVTLNRPDKRNAMSPALNDEMVRVLDALEIDDRVAVVVLTGAGDAFSAGMDLKEFFRDLDPLPYSKKMRIKRSAWQWQWKMLLTYPKPTIAMVNGWCFGGAFTPLVACDLAIAAEEAQFGLSEINWGILPGGQVTKAITAVMSHRDAMYYALTGKTFDGRKAAEMRLVNEAVPLSELKQHTRELATLLRSKNPTVLRGTKMAVRMVQEMPWEVSNDYLFAKSAESQFHDPERGRSQGLTQFLDEKSYRPGLSGYKRPE
ncbi:p-hydroxycinnamoyl CoA hydratase/lyase [Peristeroidobacter soli]|uniref:p-hydroxycinnamoyl CoA hydratase/lyase n=1 Tax=Peristeroidobacter soli TaxID=2497877 RepID=UPI001FE66533|nr:p-hydroxycinnamoyl CoA hydratase/lyase [Peristeroidobacter soli]